MNVDIASLVVNPVSNSPDLWCGFIGAILGGAISGGITWIAMKSTDKENKERWQKDSFQKKKNDLLLESLIAIANCLNFIEIDNKRLMNSNKNFCYPFKFSDFERFKNCSNSLSLLCIFYEDDCGYKKMKKLRKIATIIYAIAGMIEDIKETKGELFIKLENEKVLSFDEYNNFSVSYLEFISFIVNLENRHQDGKFYDFHKEFKMEYDYNFTKLISDFYNIAAELHKKFKYECKLSKL